MRDYGNFCDFRYSFTMLGFQFTKWFWNLWDHLLLVLLWNLLFLFAVGLLFYLSQGLPQFAEWLYGVSPGALAPASYPVLLFLPLALLLFVATVLQQVYALNNYHIAKFERNEWKTCFRRACGKRSLLAALLFDLGVILLGFVLFVSWRFYSLQGGILSFMAMGLLFWLALFALLSFGFYFPLLAREEFSVWKALRKSILVCLDNLFVSIVLFLFALFLLFISLIPPFMLFFGPVGLSLWYEVSLRLLFYKYQYLEEQASQKEINGRSKREKVDIPWRVLLRAERERIGPRSLRNFIFPWKD